jgi:hypothetical protein
LAPFPLHRTSLGGCPPPHLEVTSPGRASHPGDASARPPSSACILYCERTRKPSPAVATLAAPPSCSASAAVSHRAYLRSPLRSYPVLHNPAHAHVPSHLLVHVLTLVSAHASGRRRQPQPRCRQPSARRCAGHDLNPPCRCSPSRPSFSSPSKSVGHRRPRRGTRCPGAVEPRRQ